MTTATHFPVHDLTFGKRFSEDVMRGQATYTERFLRYGYDLVVHGIVSPLAWELPQKTLVDLYDRNVSADHLDVGVGTGLFLKQCRFPSSTPRLALMDLNENALQAAAHAVEHHSPTLYRCNVLEPIALERRFDSVGLVFLLHCIPGSFEEKGVALGHLKALLRPGGVLFGATLLQDRFTKEHPLARFVANRLRASGVFANERDTQAGLEKALSAHFSSYSLEMVGGAALFVAQNA